MILTCQLCGGLYSNTPPEMFGGKPCGCGASKRLMESRPANRDVMTALAAKWEAEANNDHWNGLIRNTYSACAAELRAALK